MQRRPNAEKLLGHCTGARTPDPLTADPPGGPTLKTSTKGARGALSIRDLVRSLERGEIASVYYLHGADCPQHGPGCRLHGGEDSRLRDEAVQAIRTAVFAGSEGNEAFNAETLDAAERRGAEVIDSALQLPFMAPRRLVLVRRAEQLFRRRAQDEGPEEAAGERDAVADYLAAPSPTTCLVLVGEKPDLRTRAGKALAGLAVLCDLTSPTDEALASWLEGEARRLGKRLRPGASELLVQYSGNALAAAAGELEKLVLYVGDEAEITEAHVEEAVADRGGAIVWAFTDALKARDAEAALARLDRYLGGFRRLEEALFPLLGILRGEIRMLLLAKEALEAGQAKGSALVLALSKRLGAHRFRVEKALAAAPRFRREELLAALARLLETDRRLKSSAVPPRLLLDAWVWRFCSGVRSEGVASTWRA